MLAAENVGYHFSKCIHFYNLTYDKHNILDVPGYKETSVDTGTVP